MKKLHLGCGGVSLPNFVNVDLRNAEGVDLVEDIAVLKTVSDNSIDLIYACHVLEHFGRVEYMAVLERWHLKLKEGGTLRISVPDFEKVVLMYNKGYELKRLWGFIYGGQTYEYNFHYVGFDFKTLKGNLEEIGFKNVRLWNWRNTEHSSFDDFSQAYIPHMDKENGVNMSLNIEASK